MTFDPDQKLGLTKGFVQAGFYCKHTFEDKKPELQECKRKLASELIADDASFVKALSKSDVEYLFS